MQWRRLSIATCLDPPALGRRQSTWLAVFTEFRPYDDEGYVLMVAKKILGGGRPYEDAYLQYRPFLVAWKALVHCLIGVPLSHDGVRMETTALLGVTLAVVAWGVYELTRSNATAMSALLVNGVQRIAT